MNKYILSLFSLLILWSCGPKEGEIFSNPSPEETGILFENTLTESNDLNILDYLYFYNGGGLAIGDIDNDGLPDVFFSGNQVKNKLYLNKGNLKFEDITEKAQVAGHSSWNTGAVMGDVNGDGLLDIYVCAVVGLNGFNGHNELFINNGDLTFTESAAQYGLDFESFSSSAAFLDYDGDGDLDIYILNHAVHTQESIGYARLRNKRDYQTGDKLLRNDNGKFVDVSEEAGIYGGVNGYGLGISIADFNQDGWPDIYVGNDFHEDDYYYLNNGDGTFTESLRQYFGHTARFSMGNDVADINHDGWPDLISLDMLPENEEVLKASDGDENRQIQKMRIEQYGYHYQFPRNMLNINQQNSPYMETALMSGVAATDWSWSALFGDYNQDGEQDLFISNGIPKRPNNLDFINFVSSEEMKKKISNTKLVDQKALEMMPSGKIHNYIFKGNGDLTFSDKSGQWTVKDTLVSGATALADLDNDGDLDIVVNTINSPAAVYINSTNDQASYLKLKFKLQGNNAFGLGTKAYAYHEGKLQYKELYTVRGFQASSEPMLHFGFGKIATLDSLKIVWPNSTYQTIKKVALNQTLTLSPNQVKPFTYEHKALEVKKMFTRVTDHLGINFRHIEDAYTDFNRQKLIPYQLSDRGPATALGDLNNDGKTDIFFGGSKHLPSKVYVQNDSAFVELHIPEIEKDSINEEVAAVIADFTKNGKNDLITGTGGADFYGQMKPLLDRYYTQTDSTFTSSDFPEYFENAAVIAPYDVDGDGYLDVFVGNQVVSGDFGKLPASYLLKNKAGRFSIVENEELKNVGMVTDAIWDDFTGDGVKDLIVVGEWMSPTFFKNEKGKLIKTAVLSNDMNGLWQRIIAFDIDGDGDRDYLLGNWGTNTKFETSEKYPLKLYYSDFDSNGSTETIVVTEKNGEYYPLEHLDGLAGQIVSLRKKFTTYTDFAGKNIDQIFDTSQLDKAVQLNVNELRSGYLKNEGGTFTFVPFMNELQIAPITAFLKHDFDGNGKDEVLVAGNYFGVKPLHGRFDSFPGALIRDEKSIILGHKIGLDFAHKAVRHLNIITVKGKPFLMATINNDSIQVYKIDL